MDLNTARPFHDKVIVITGASSGIGQEMALKFASLGAQVVLAARSGDKLAELARQIGPNALPLVLDVTKNEDALHAAEQVMARFGRIDVWINNAGFGVFATLLEASLSDMEEMMDVNYMGMVRCTKAVLPFMLQAGRGQIVNIASIAGKIGSPKSTGYAASKHAMLGFTDSLRQELAGSGITVTAVNPGPIDTPFFNRADPSGTYVANVRWFMMRPEQVADAVVKAVRKRKAEINLPLAAAVGVAVYRMFPRMLDRIAGRLLNRK